MPDKFDPYREALVVEVQTIWPEELGDVAEQERQRIETLLHSDPARAANLSYIRMHTGFCRQITVSRGRPRRRGCRRSEPTEAEGSNVNKSDLRVDVQLGLRSYPIEIGTRLLRELGSRLTQHTEVSHAVIITDDHVLPHARRAQETLAAQEMRVDLCSITPGERSKSVAEAARLWQELLRCGTDRKSVVVAVGGGWWGISPDFSPPRTLADCGSVRFPPVCWPR